MTPPAWFDQLVKALGTNARLFLIGDEPDMVARAAATMEALYAPAKVLGVHHGFFSFGGQEEEALVRTINAASPAVLLVGMGMPRQERWLAANAARLNTPVVMAVGALFRRLAGIEPRPPSWVADHGLEWLTRLARHPAALFDRYVIGIPLFAGILARQWWHARRG
jgi:N-acetylglucosaminyldiphosphoundecaprenol N-acetyl-beta-D-mannosaminyltransferase